MKYVQIIAACDMTKTQDGEIAEAAETVYLAFGTDPKHLQARELDLAEGWAKQLREFLAPYIAASHEPGELATPEVRPAAPDLDGDTARKRSRRYNKAMARWADANGYNVTRNEGNGKPYFPVKTRQAYAHHLTGRDDLLTEDNDLQPDFDPATGNSV